jgi:hypothetical protein
VSYKKDVVIPNDNALRRTYNKLHGKFEFKRVKQYTEQLNKVAGKQWTVRYVYGVLRGYNKFKLSDDMAVAAEKLFHDNGQELPVKIFNGVLSFTDLPPGTIIIANAVACSGPDCRTIFIPPYASQRYCSKQCKQKARNLRRQQKRKEK